MKHPLKIHYPSKKMNKKKSSLRQKISNFLFYLFVFLLPWQTVFLLREKFISGEKFQYDTISIYLFEIILLSWFLSLLKFSKLKPRKLLLNFKKLLQQNNLYIFLSLFIIWSFLSIFWSSDKLLASSFFIKILLGIGLFIAILRSKINIRKLILVFLISATLQGILGIWQFTQQTTFSNKWLGVNSHAVWQGGTSVLQNESGRWLRAYGGLNHPNILGGYLLVALFFSLYLYLKTTKFKFYQKILLLFSIIIIFSTFLMTFSRSSYLAFFIGTFFIITYFISQKKQASLHHLSIPFLIIILIGIFFTAIYSNLLFSRLHHNSRLEQKSLNDRMVYVSEAEHLISNYPLIGVGLGNYTSAVYREGVFKKPVWQYQPVHNVFILILAELGLVGVILFASIIITLLWKISILFKKKSVEESLSVIIFFSVAFISLITISIFDHWLWTTDSGILLFWLSAGLFARRNFKI